VGVQGEFFKTLALVQSLTYTLKFELHDNSKPGDRSALQIPDAYKPVQKSDVVK
jgi:hypothetical protein